MMIWELELMYDDYFFTCEKENIKPKDFETWAKELLEEY